MRARRPHPMTRPHPPVRLCLGLLLAMLLAAGIGAAEETSATLQEKIEAGQAVYQRTCIACHQANGEGIPSVYPPLAKSDYLIEDLDRAIRGVLKGQSGEIVVRGKTYNMLMPPQMLNNREVAQVLTYVLHSWGNPGGEITVDRVEKVRSDSE